MPENVCLSLEIEQLLNKTESNNIDNMWEAFLLAKELLNMSQTDTYQTILGILGKLSRFFAEKRIFDKATEIAEFLSDFAEENNNPELLIKYLNESAALFLAKGNYNKSLELADKAYLLMTEKYPEYALVQVYITLGKTFQSLNNYQKSYEFLMAAMDFAKQKEDLKAQMNICMNLQVYFYNLNDLEAVRKYGEKGLELAEQLGDEHSKIALANNLGTVLINKGNFIKAAECFEKSAAALRNTTTQFDWLINTLMNCGIAYFNLNEFEKSETRLLESLEISEKYHFQLSSGKVLLNLGRCYLYKKDYRKAEEALLAAEKIQRTENSLADLLNTLNYKCEIYELTNRKDEAITLLKEMLETRMQLFTEETSAKMADMRTRFELEQKEREKELLLIKNQELAKRNEELEKAQGEIRKLEQHNSIYAMAVTTNHELNQPLTVISGNLELLAKTLDTQNEKINLYIRRLTNAVHQIDDILTKYRTQSGFRFTHYLDNTLMVTFGDEYSGDSLD